MLRLVTAEEVAGPLPLPRARECVVCFVERMVAAYGCTCRLHWASDWRDRMAPRATALERRLASMGGCCDCEVLLTAYARPGDLARAGDDADETSTASMPDCLGVSRTGSVEPCAQWIPASSA